MLKKKKKHRQCDKLRHNLPTPILDFLLSISHCHHLTVFSCFVVVDVVFSVELYHLEMIFFSNWKSAAWTSHLSLLNETLVKELANYGLYYEGTIIFLCLYVCL